MDTQHTCPKCGKYNLKQINSKKTGKRYWVCQGPTEECNAIYSDSGGKPEFPEENPGALLMLEWLSDEDRMKALSAWELNFISGLATKAEEQLDSPLTFTSKQLDVLRKIGSRFANSPTV